jgi:hypothetical protein
MPKKVSKSPQIVYLTSFAFRKKKCDGGYPLCLTCERLGLHCGGYQSEILWEDDKRREGMRRRGRASRPRPRAQDHVFVEIKVGDSVMNVDKEGVVNPKKMHVIVSDDNFNIDSTGLNLDIPIFDTLSSYLRELNPKQILLFDRYINRFSRIYPSCSRPSNPFLSVFLPMAMSNGVILSGLLALSGAQTWGAEWAELQHETLRAKHHVLTSCRKVLTNINQIDLSTGVSMGDTDLLHLLASVTTLLIYEKLSGENSNFWKPHLQFIGHMFDNAERVISSSCRDSEAFQFLLHIFIYNDLVGSTSLRTKTLSNFYIDAAASRPQASVPRGSLGLLKSGILDTNRYYYPSLISRISAGDLLVTLSDINSWNGQLSWFPSYCLEKSDEMRPDLAVAAELYRTAAIIHHQHMLGENCAVDNSQPPFSDPIDYHDPFYHHRRAVQLMNLVPNASPVENVLLWPISIFAPDLTSVHAIERECISERLGRLERRFRMRHFCRAREILRERWNAMDMGMDYEPVLYDSILQG